MRAGRAFFAGRALRRADRMQYCTTVKGSFVCLRVSTESLSLSPGNGHSRTSTARVGGAVSRKNFGSFRAAVTFPRIPLSAIVRDYFDPAREIAASRRSTRKSVYFFLPRYCPRRFFSRHGGFPGPRPVLLPPPRCNVINGSRFSAERRFVSENNGCTGPRALMSEKIKATSGRGKRRGDQRFSLSLPETLSLLARNVLAALLRRHVRNAARRAGGRNVAR